MFPRPLFSLKIDARKHGDTGQLLDLATRTFSSAGVLDVMDYYHVHLFGGFEVRQTILLGPVALTRYWGQEDLWIARSPEGELWLLANIPERAHLLEVPHVP